MYDLGIINGYVYQDGNFVKTNLYIHDGIIAKITPEILSSEETYDCENNLVLPGIIDPHTHFELDLGTTVSKDDFYTGTRAAAFGGVTTIIDFLEPIDNKKDLEKSFYKRVKQAENAVVDYKFHACLKNPKHNVESIVSELSKFGLNTVKIFTTYSDSNRRTYEPEIKKLLELSKDNNYTLLVHIENDELITIDKNDAYLKLPLNRPTISETSEALKLAQLVKETGGRLYMVHLSSGETLSQLVSSYKDIINKHFIIESCPHYFTWNNHILDTEAGHLYTMAPPLRSEEERLLLKSHIEDVYTIGTDHCTFNAIEKDKTKLVDIPLGVGGVEESFRIMYTLFGDSIISKMTENVAKAHYLYPQKGVLQVGSDADMFIYKKGKFKINESHGNTDHNIYYGKAVNGKVITTISRGRFVVKDRVFIPQKGRLLHQIGGTHENT